MPAAARKPDASVEERTRAFYDTVGWVADARGCIGEDAHFRDDSPERSGYDEKCASKPMGVLSGVSGDLLIAGPGDFPKSHELAAAQFERVHCVDISERALGICEAKLGAKGRYALGSLLNLPAADTSMDAALCAHVLFHIDKDEQARAVAELIRVVKPGGRIVIVYGNPHAPLLLAQRFLKFFGVHKLLKANRLYYFNHPRAWWATAAAPCRTAIHPYNIMSRKQMNALLPIAGLRERVFRWASRFEDRHPRAAARLWTYIAVEISKPA